MLAEGFYCNNCVRVMRAVMTDGGVCKQECVLLCKQYHCGYYDSVSVIVAAHQRSFTLTGNKQTLFPSLLSATSLIPLAMYNWIHI